jgi:hypothetical protein
MEMDASEFMGNGGASTWKHDLFEDHEKTFEGNYGSNSNSNSSSNNQPPRNSNNPKNNYYVKKKEEYHEYGAGDGYHYIHKEKEFDHFDPRKIEFLEFNILVDSESRKFKIALKESLLNEDYEEIDEMLEAALKNIFKDLPEADFALPSLLETKITIYSELHATTQHRTYELLLEDCLQAYAKATRAYY